MTTINPMQIHGAWRLGWVLDFHTQRSEFLGYDEYGHERFDTTRSPLGELLYLLKYKGQQTGGQVADVMAQYLQGKPNLLAQTDLVVPVSPSTPRTTQPVEVLAAELAQRLGKRSSFSVIQRTRQTPALKNIHDLEERREALEGVFMADANQVRERGVLLIDDLYRSGATANAVTEALLAAGAARVYFLAATRTRSSS